MSSISLDKYWEMQRNKRSERRKRAVKGVKKRSEGEEGLALQLKALKIEFTREYKFHPSRKWSADFHLTDTKILIEVEGGIWMEGGGRHNRGKGYINDMEKYNAASMLGYQILRFSTQQVSAGVAIEQIERIIKV